MKFFKHDEREKMTSYHEREKNMRETILTHLHKIAEDHHVSILFAVESGSRMWGFHTDIPNDLDKSSDYDVRGVFVRPKEAYLGIKKFSEQIEHFEYTNKGTLYMDIVLWDIRKFSKLAVESNPSVYEWLQSPIVYIGNFHKEQFRVLFYSYGSLNALSYHYLGMMIKNYHMYVKNKEKVSYKKYLYILRAIACYYACQEGNFPNMHYTLILEYLPASLKTIFQNIVNKKQEGGEKMMGEPYEEISQLCEALFEKKKQMKLEIKVHQKLIQRLNSLTTDIILYQR